MLLTIRQIESETKRFSSLFTLLCIVPSKTATADDLASEEDGFVCVLLEARIMMKWSGLRHSRGNKTDIPADRVLALRERDWKRKVITRSETCGGALGCEQQPIGD